MGFKVWQVHYTYLVDQKKLFDVFLAARLKKSEELAVLVTQKQLKGAFRVPKRETKDRSRPRTPLSLRSYMTKRLDWGAKSVQIDLMTVNFQNYY